MQIILLVAGLILLIAGGSWFAAATTVGWVCLGVFALITLAQIAVIKTVRNTQKDILRRF